jgi:multidrug efflux pump subunit AcrA (membrane-fusion protein)
MSMPLIDPVEIRATIKRLGLIKPVVVENREPLRQKREAEKADAARAKREAARAKREAARAKREAARVEREAARAKREAARVERERKKAEAARVRRGKPCVCTFPDGREIKYPSVRSAAQATGRRECGLSKACARQCASGGLRWRYAGAPIAAPKLNGRPRKAVIATYSDGREVVYESIEAAARAVGGHVGDIGKCVKRRYKGAEWRYA